MNVQNIRAVRTGLATMALAAAGALVFAGCTTGDAGGAPSADGGTEPTAGSCGSVPEIGAQDPDGLLAGFSDDIQAGYNGYPFPIEESTWAEWQSPKSGDYTAAIVGQAPSAPSIATYLEALASALDSAGVDIVLNVAPNDPRDVPGQIQMFNQALSLKPDIIFFIPAAPEAAIDLVAQAADAGIPVVTGLGAVDSPSAINMVFNQNLQAMETAAGVVGAIEGNGTVLQVNGIPGVATQTFWEDGISKVLDLCPDVTVAGPVEGLFQPPVAQQAVVQYLATNPAGVDGVLQAGTMGWAIRDAFEQSGLPVPPITDNGASQGMAAWAAEQDDYAYFGTATPMVPLAEGAAEVGLKVLAGAGPKINQVVWKPYLVDSSNLDDVVDPSWEHSDPTDLAPDGVYFTDEQLAEFFNKPELGPQSAN